MLHASTKKLIDRLSEMTELGKLDWTDGDNGNITFATEGYSVSLTESPNEVVIASLDGVELERATVDELATTQLDDGTTYTAIVAAMTKEASRIARGTETAISTLLAGMQDAPADAEVEEHIETAEDLQEDLGDETAIVTADAIDAVEAEASIEDGETEFTEEETPSEIGASWKDTIETQAETEVADDAELSETEETSAEASTEIEADTEVETDEVSDSSLDSDAEPESVLVAEPETTDEIAAEPETTSESEALSEAELASDDETTDEIESETPVLAEAEAFGSQEESANPTADTEAEEVDDAEEAEAAPFVAFSATADDTETEDTTETEFSNEMESESEVSEAVARLADEVNTDDDSSGLATAAASAVGAVALAAGLAPQSSEEETDDATGEETVELAEAEAEPIEGIESTETGVSEAPPAYVPFGLEAEAEAETVDTAIDVDEPIETVTEIEDTSIEVDTPIEATADVETATESEIIVDLEVPATPTEELAQMVDDALAPHEAAAAELEAESSLTVDVEPEEGESSFTVDVQPDEGEVGFASAAVVPETEAIDDADFTATFETEEDTASSDAIEATEAVEESVLVKSSETTEPEESAPQSYSLSGIGAGFGLGALSAKTEASGLPSVSEARPASGEKVIIDATDDVLPKPEGNLNVALAETASAAVSAANAEPALETVGADEEEAEPEADILKPRTRFNPWD